MCFKYFTRQSFWLFVVLAWNWCVFMAAWTSTLRCSPSRLEISARPCLCWQNVLFRLQKHVRRWFWGLKSSLESCFWEPLVKIVKTSQLSKFALWRQNMSILCFLADPNLCSRSCRSQALQYRLSFQGLNWVRSRLRRKSGEYEGKFRMSKPGWSRGWISACTSYETCSNFDHHERQKQVMQSKLFTESTQQDADQDGCHATKCPYASTQANSKKFRDWSKICLKIIISSSAFELWHKHCQSMRWSWLLMTIL